MVRLTPASFGTWRWKFGLVKHSPIFWGALVAIFVYLMLCTWTLIFVEQPYVLGTGGLRLGADSTTYFDVAKLAHTSLEGVALVSFSGNLLGPVAIAYLLESPLNVFLFNTLLFLMSIAIAARIPGVRWVTFAILLMANAETLASVVSLNKEILSLVSMTLFAFFLNQKKRSKILLGFTLLLSLLVRWEQVAIMLLFLAQQYFRPLARRPKTTLLLILLALSVAYPVALQGHSEDFSNFTVQGETSATILLLNNIQAHFGYPIVVVPKLLLSIMGELLTPLFILKSLTEPGPLDIQNDIVINLHSMAMALLIIYGIARKRLDLKRPVILFCALYLLITTISPVVQTRYEYPIYVLIALEIASQGRLRSWRSERAPLISSASQQLGTAKI
jgi:hypothetical protein